VISQSYDVFIHSEGVYGNLMQRGAHISIVSYYKNGIYFENVVENDDLTFMEEE